MKNLKIVVTGGSGFLGRYLIKELIDNGGDVTIFDLNEPSKKNSNYTEGSGYYEGDILNIDDCKAAFKNADIVIHLAAIIGALTDLPPEKVFSINTMGTFNVFEAAHDASVDKVIYTSSDASYGYNFKKTREEIFKPEYLPVDESYTQKPIDLYGTTKKISEEIAEFFNKKNEISAIGLRISHIRIPISSDPEKTDINKLSELEIFRSIETYQKNLLDFGTMLMPIKPRIFGKGKNKVWSGYIFSYNDVRDVVLAFNLAIENKSLEGKHEIFCIGNMEDNGTKYSTRELIEKYGFEDVPLKRDFKEREPLFSCDKARDILGYQSKFNWWELYGSKLFS